MKNAAFTWKTIQDGSQNPIENAQLHSLEMVLPSTQKQQCVTACLEISIYIYQYMTYIYQYIYTNIYIYIHHVYDLAKFGSGFESRYIHQIIQKIR